jgi:polyether ionophore transport system permease protein
MTTTVERARPAPVAVTGRRDHGTLTGTGALIRLILRRDRVRTPVWVIGVTFLVWVQAASIDGLYPTQADLAEAAASFEGNPALEAFSGPTVGLDTLGGMTAWQIAIYGAIALALMSLFMVSRHTRAEEESGRAELARSTVVGRHAPLTAVLLVMTAANAAVVLLVTLVLPPIGLSVSGSFALGAAMAGCGWMFGAVTAVTAQLSENTHVGSGMAGALLGLAFMLRAAGDVGDGVLTWLSPIGWTSMVQAFAGERWWVLGLFAASVLVLVPVAFALESRRDVGAGLVAARPGPPRAPAYLLRTTGLAWRLGRAVLLAWAVGLFVFGVSYGSVGNDIGDLIGDSEAARDFLAPGGGDLTDLFWVTTALQLALVGTGYALMAVLRLRTEESAGRAEPVLAGAVPQTTWMGTYVGLALVGTVAVLAAGGAGTGLAYGIAVGDIGQVIRLTGVAIAYVPAVWVLIGLAAALFGWVPRAMAAVWAALTYCAFVGILASLLDLPSWVQDLSPFTHVPEVPATDLDVVPLVALTLVAAALVAAGLVGFRRRDVST